MTPQERKLLDELFDRLQTLESTPRDPDAVRAINEGLQRAPNALYPLVQTALVQDEALKQADARIRQLEAELGADQPQREPQPGFLDSMRDAVLGRSEPRGSVPSVKPESSSPWRNTTGRPEGYAEPRAGYQPPGAGAGYQPPGAGSPSGLPGGSFLGSAAATAAGVVGGSLLMNSFRNMFGGQGQSSGQGQSQSALDSAGTSGSPWGGNLGNTDLARDAGIGDIGASGDRMASNEDQRGSERAGMLDSSQDDSGSEDDFDDGDFDFGDDDSDTA
jgi:hypothetical protein